MLTLTPGNACKKDQAHLIEKMQYSCIRALPDGILRKKTFISLPCCLLHLKKDSQKHGISFCFFSSDTCIPLYSSLFLLVCSGFAHSIPRAPVHTCKCFETVLKGKVGQPALLSTVFGENTGKFTLLCFPMGTAAAATCRFALSLAPATMFGFGEEDRLLLEEQVKQCSVFSVFHQLTFSVTPTWKSLSPRAPFSPIRGYQQLSNRLTEIQHLQAPTCMANNQPHSAL